MAHASSFSMDYHSLPLALLILLWGVVLASSAPAAFDWRNVRGRNFVTPVRNQLLLCDHSWAFAAVSVVESALLIRTRRSFDLSEQQVLDCSKGGGSLGCIKGNVYDALSFITRGGPLSGGLFKEQRYRYIGVGSSSCRHPLGTSLIPTHGLKPHLTVGNDENELAKALVHGPVAVTMCFRSDLVTYRRGIYNNPDCNANCNNTISMTLVGYGTEGEAPYWILKNSWGDLRGEDGYIKLARGYNMCGIVTHPSYFLKRTSNN